MNRRFIGGMRSYRAGTTEPSLWRGANATWPLAELLIDDEGNRVRVRWSWIRNLWAYSSRYGASFQKGTKLEWKLRSTR